MDPASAFSLAAVVIQVVDFGARVLSDTHDIYGVQGSQQRSLSLCGVVHARKRAVQPDDGNAEADAKRGSSMLPKPQSCRRNIVSALRTLFAGERKALQASGTSRISIAASSFVKVLESVWSRKKINGIQDELGEIRSQMTMAVLVSIW
jgi:hypothetical protein